MNGLYTGIQQMLLNGVVLFCYILFLSYRKHVKKFSYNILDLLYHVDCGSNSFYLSFMNMI